jgi:ribonucleoside-diphosphate reductase alpha chain
VWGGPPPPPTAPAGAASNVTALRGGIQGATALKAEPMDEEELELGSTDALPWSAPTPAPAPAASGPTKAEARAIARAKGYEGEACPECQNFTMVRNGTCLKCETCGSTTGCS